MTMGSLKQACEEKPRESILLAEYANAIEVINKDQPPENQLKFLHWDLSTHHKIRYTWLTCFEYARKHTFPFLSFGIISEFANLRNNLNFQQCCRSVSADGQSGYVCSKLYGLPLL